MKHIVSFSGGKDSTAMLLMMLEKGMHIDEIIFVDTGVEFPEMYEHINKVEKYIDRSITYLKAEKGFNYYFSEHIKTRGKRKGERGYGWALNKFRWCTLRLKLDVIHEYRKNLNCCFYIGIAAGEAHRAKDEKYPLMEWGITELEALQYCYDKGFDWGGLYEIFNRVSCWLCPFQSLKSLKGLYKHRPELWTKLKDMDELVERKFRGIGIIELEKRFNNEKRS